MRDLDIAQVAQRSRVPASTLRFYEEKGLIASVGRRGLRRLFDPEVVERLALIAVGRAAGFSLGAPSHMECPTFRRILRAASSGAIRMRRTKVKAARRLLSGAGKA